jgi:septal ring factor EnvC (AmiA/AmiB activator)
MSEVLKNVTNSLKKSPEKLTMLLIVGGFLLYLFRHDSLQYEEKKMVDLVAKQRIDNCHRIQSDGIKVMERLNDTLNNHDKAFVELLYSLKDFKKSLEANNAKIAETNDNIEKLNSKLSDLERSLNAQGDPNEALIAIFNEIRKQLDDINRKIK